MLNFNSLTKIAEGKTKLIYSDPKRPNVRYMVFKDDITAGDGAKHDIIEGKAVLDWRVNRDIFEYLNRKGVRTHYLESPEERVTLVKALDRKINLEAVSRRVAAGSILKWGKAEEGTKYDPVVTQFHYKDDPLHDPLLDEEFVNYLIHEKGASEYAEMRRINADVMLHLERAFATFGIQLVDLKLEYGMIENQVHVIDEVSGGSLRLWPYRTDKPNLNQPNVLKELNPEGRLDKDTYRMGGGLEAVKSKFEVIAGITERFKDLP